MRSACLVCAFALVAVESGCGARTPLDAAARDAGPESQADSAPDVTAALTEAGPDATDGSPDALDATPDVVEAGPDGPADGAPCESGADCPDPSYCTIGTCDPARGCVFSPRSCDDAVACTTDTCDARKKKCVHAPDDTLCPSDELCSATHGCASFVYGAASDGHLYEVDVASAQLTDLGASQAFAGDIALAPDGTLYTTDSYVLYTADRADSTTTPVGSIMPLHQYNGLGLQPDGTLFATADTPAIFAIDATLASATALASLPVGYRASGDLASVSVGPAGSQLFVTLTSANAQSTDSLALVSIAAGSVMVVGDTGFSCVWGLATLGSTLYGLTCQGLLVSLDTTTGRGTMLGQAQPAFFGAAGR